jgi:hypothetical protein
VVAVVVVVIDERVDLGLKIARYVVVLEQDAVFERLVLSLDLSLGARMERGITLQSGRAKTHKHYGARA